MRGQRLFIRPIDAADHDIVQTFLQNHRGRSDVPAYGLLAKLAGELVAVVAIDITDDAVRVADLVVATELRRKRIGRAMLGEVAQIAVKMERARLVVDDAAGADEFFRRVGFASEGGVWTKVV
ncbi:MAG TPA: GNAT family N-acetyltransferase [Thermoanaerobaculia bacterium]|nr:GNAT family N-acetyltransferase [Thermoanaerobaculia bacterium]